MSGCGTMRRSLCALAACCATVALAGGAQAAISGDISNFEEIWDYRTGVITGENWQDNQAGPASIHYPDHAGHNSAAYVDPNQQIIRAYAIAYTVDPSGSVVDPSPNPPPYQNDRSLARVIASFDNQLIVGAGSTNLAPSTPVQISVRIRLDGQLMLGHVGGDPGSTSSWSEVDAGYRITDPNASGGGEVLRSRIAQPNAYSAPLMSFGFSADAKSETWRPNPRYGTTGGYSVEHAYDWSISSNHGDYFEDSYDYYKEYPYPDTPVVSDLPSSNIVFGVDTNVLQVTIDTYVGATLDVHGSMNMLMQSRYNAPLAGADFLHTFGTSFTAAPGFEGLDLSLASVPEPTAALWLLGSPLLLLSRRRSR